MPRRGREGVGARGRRTRPNCGRCARRSRRPPRRAPHAESRSWALRMDAGRTPVVAAIHGYCLGGGLEPRNGVRRAVWLPRTRSSTGLPRSSSSLIPGGGGGGPLPGVVQGMAARGYMSTLTAIRSRRAACDWGLVEKVMPGRAAGRRALEIARDALGRSRFAMGVIEEGAGATRDLPLADGLQREATAFVRSSAPAAAGRGRDGVGRSASRSSRADEGGGSPTNPGSRSGVRTCPRSPSAPRGRSSSRGRGRQRSTSPERADRPAEGIRRRPAAGDPRRRGRRRDRRSARRGIRPRGPAAALPSKASPSTVPGGSSTFPPDATYAEGAAFLTTISDRVDPDDATGPSPRRLERARDRRGGRRRDGPRSRWRHSAGRTSTAAAGSEEKRELARRLGAPARSRPRRSAGWTTSTWSSTRSAARFSRRASARFAGSASRSGSASPAGRGGRSTRQGW